MHFITQFFGTLCWAFAGYLVRELQLSRRSRRALQYYQAGQPGFWHTTAYIEALYIGKPTDQTLANRDQEAQEYATVILKQVSHHRSFITQH